MISRWPFAPLFFLLALVVRNGGISIRRTPMLVVYILRFTVFEPFRLAERFLYDGAIRSRPLEEPPIFILGHWRSGTSHLQTLMSLDSRLTSSTIYRSFFSDSFYLTERWLKPVLNGVARIIGLRFSIQRSALNLDLLAEGDLGLCCMASRYSYTWGHLFPARFNQWLDRLVLSPDASHQEGWLSVYDTFLRKLSHGSGGKRVVMKSPGDTARMKLLARHYPGAKFIYIHRTPAEVFHSSRYLWEVILKEHGLQTLDQAEVDELIIGNYRSLLLSYARQKADMPPDQLVEIQYSDLRDDPVAELSKVYAQLGLGEVEEDAIRGFLDKQVPYGAQAYQTPDSLQDKLQGEWQEVQHALEGSPAQ